MVINKIFKYKKLLQLDWVPWSYWSMNLFLCLFAFSIFVRDIFISFVLRCFTLNPFHELFRKIMILWPSFHLSIFTHEIKKKKHCLEDSLRQLFIHISRHILDTNSWTEDSGFWAPYWSEVKTPSKNKVLPSLTRWDSDCNLLPGRQKYSPLS